VRLGFRQVRGLANKDGAEIAAARTSFLRADLANRRIVTCSEAMNAHDGKWLTTAGLVLMRQKPGSARASCLSPSRTRPASPTW
jgi:hypothetical protein